MSIRRLEKSGLFGRRIHIAGSASPKTDASLVRYAHALVRAVVQLILENGGGLVLFAGKEPSAPSPAPEALSLTFDWTALEVVADCLRKKLCTWPTAGGPPIVVVTSGKAESEIPQTRNALWQELLATNHVRLESILPGARSGALVRELQVRFGDILLTLGGGTGVEHLAQEYTRRRRHVIPLDIDLGSSRDDGMGGSLRLNSEARAEPTKFLRLQDELSGRENSRLASITCRQGTATSDSVAAAVFFLLRELAMPKAFYVRLLNQKSELFRPVEMFFRNVVDPVVLSLGFQRVEVGTNRAEHGFLNVGIFENPHFASVVVVDVTGERPNCFIELGYALGRQHRVIVTARRNTELPFDQQAIPCHFWQEDDDDATRRAALLEFWQRNVDRPSLIA